MRGARALALAVGLCAIGLGSPALAKGKSTVRMTGVLNLNTASQAQLDLLPGVGEKAASRIIAHRQKTPFRRPEELVDVKGFGKKRFEKLRTHLTVSGPTTLSVQKVIDDSAVRQGRSAPPAR